MTTHNNMPPASALGTSAVLEKLPFRYEALRGHPTVSFETAYASWHLPVERMIARRLPAYTHEWVPDLAQDVWERLCKKGRWEQYCAECKDAGSQLAVVARIAANICIDFMRQWRHPSNIGSAIPFSRFVEEFGDGNMGMLDEADPNPWHNPLERMELLDLSERAEQMLRLLNAWISPMQRPVVALMLQGLSTREIYTTLKESGYSRSESAVKMVCSRARGLLMMAGYGPDTKEHRKAHRSHPSHMSFPTPPQARAS